LELRAYSDANHGYDLTDHNSVTGFCIFLGDSLFSWKSKKQSIVSQSSTEAEYRDMGSTTKEIIWLCWLLVDMRVSLSHPTPMYCENQSFIQIAHNSVFHGTITLPFVSSSLQITDFFTKSHSISHFCFLVGKS
jgi:hypothetical protein